MFRKKYTTKKDSNAPNKTRETLGAKHSEYLSKFEKQQTKELPAKLKEYEIARKEYKRLCDKEKETVLSGAEHNTKFLLVKQLKSLKKEIKSLKNRDEENDYFLKTAQIVSEYEKTQNKKKKPKVTTSIQSFFSAPLQSSNNIASHLKDDQSNGKITNFFGISETSVNRAQLQNLYLKQIDPNYIADEEYDENAESNPNKCPNPKCGSIDKVVFDFNIGRRNCGECGLELDYFFDPVFNSFKATQSIELTPAFPYKRIAHLSDWLNKIQGKENTDIPKYVFEDLKKEFKKYRIFDYSNLQEDFVKKCLKKLGLNKYYDHIMYIIHQFNGMPPPQMSVELEERFKKMFMEIQAPFEKYCPSDRKNFLSYSYVFHKFCELLELDDLLPYFPLLKSREKLFQQDKIWKQICEELQWQYIPSL